METIAAGPVGPMWLKAYAWCAYPNQVGRFGLGCVTELWMPPRFPVAIDLGTSMVRS